MYGCVDLIFQSKDFNTLCVQTAAEDLINGLEEYIAESFVRTAPLTHNPLPQYYSVLDMQ